MPKESQDNTRVEQPVILIPPTIKELNLPEEDLRPLEQDQLWGADKVKRYRDLQKFYNSNVFGYGLQGYQTNYDPRSHQGRAQIQSNFNYANNNATVFDILTSTATLAGEAAQFIRWGTTPIKIGEGAEAIVSAAPLSTKVTKVTTIPRAEMHVRNTVPRALKSNPVSTQNGLTTYTQPKVNILSPEQLKKATKALERAMAKKGWKKIEHPNLDGPAFTNGRHVVSDIGQGNVGRDWFGRVRLTDFSVETLPQFRLAMQKKGGLLNINN